MTGGGSVSIKIDFLNKIKRWKVTNTCIHVSSISVVFKDLSLFIGEQFAARKNALCGNNISRDAALCTMELAC